MKQTFIQVAASIVLAIVAAGFFYDSGVLLFRYGDKKQAVLHLAPAVSFALLYVRCAYQIGRKQDDRLEQAIVETGARLVILDPIQAYIGAKIDMHRANEIRPVLKHLGMIAEKYNCAIVLIGHMNKAAGSKSTYRGLGSIDIQATARSVLLVARLRDKSNIRIMAHDKSSLAPTGDSIGFEMTEDSGMICIGPYDITIDELLSGNEGRGKKKLDIAENFIKEYFGSSKEIISNDILQEAARRGIKRNTLLSAKKKLGITSGKGKAEDGTSYWTWLLPQ